MPRALALTARTRLASAIDRVADIVGRVAAWGALAMMIAEFVIILARYLFGAGSLWLQESLVYFNAALILFAASWTLREGGHVRVDVFYANASPRAKAWVDLVGAIAFLLPFMIAVIWLTWPYAARSWTLREGSRETSGLPLVFLLKGMIPLFAAHLALQGCAQILRAVDALRARPVKTASS